MKLLKLLSIIGLGIGLYSAILELSLGIAFMFVMVLNGGLVWMQQRQIDEKNYLLKQRNTLVELLKEKNGSKEIYQINN